MSSEVPGTDRARPTVRQTAARRSRRWRSWMRARRTCRGYDILSLVTWWLPRLRLLVAWWTWRPRGTHPRSPRPGSGGPNCFGRGCGGSSCAELDLTCSLWSPLDGDANEEDLSGRRRWRRTSDGASSRRPRHWSPDNKVTASTAEELREYLVAVASHGFMPGFSAVLRGVCVYVFKMVLLYMWR